MLTLRAFFALALERGFANMTDHTRACGHWLLNVLSFALGQGKRFFWLGLICFLEWISRALFATTVVAASAHFVDTKLDLAAMTCAMDPHANLFLHAR